MGANEGSWEQLRSVLLTRNKIEDAGERSFVSWCLKGNSYICPVSRQEEAERQRGNREGPQR
jgi:hypothetical protein